MKLLFAFSFLFLVIYESHGQNQSKKDKIMTLIELLHSDSSTIKAVDKMYNTIHFDVSSAFKDSSYWKNISSLITDTSQLQEMKKMTHDTAFTSQIQQSLNLLSNTEPVYSKEQLQSIAQKFIHEDLVLLYDKYYSTEEIEDLIAFYKTKTGQKIIYRMPLIQSESLDILKEKYFPILKTNQ